MKMKAVSSLLFLNSFAIHQFYTGHVYWAYALFQAWGLGPGLQK